MKAFQLPLPLFQPEHIVSQVEKVAKTAQTNSRKPKETRKRRAR